MSLLKGGHCNSASSVKQYDTVQVRKSSVTRTRIKVFQQISCVEVAGSAITWMLVTCDSLTGKITLACAAETCITLSCSGKA